MEDFLRRAGMTAENLGRADILEPLYDVELTPATIEGKLTTEYFCSNHLDWDPGSVVRYHRGDSRVSPGSAVRVRLFLSDDEREHQSVNVAMAGVRAPRVSTKQRELSEQLGEEVTRIYAIVFCYRVSTGDIFWGRPSSLRSRGCFNDPFGSRFSLYRNRPPLHRAGSSVLPPATMFIGNSKCSIRRFPKKNGLSCLIRRSHPPCGKHCRALRRGWFRSCRRLARWYAR